MTAGSVLRHPIKLLAQRLRNGKRSGQGAASLDEHLRAEGEEAEGEARKPAPLIVGEPYIEIWDNDEDAIYDDL